jgi:phage protein D
LKPGTALTVFLCNNHHSGWRYAKRTLSCCRCGKFKPGTKIVISAGYDSKTQVIFEGIVIKHAVKINGENYSRLIIECRDKALAMTVGRKNASYVNKTDNQIISTLISNHAV